MGFCSSGGFSGLVAFLAMAAMIAPLVPHVFWVKTSFTDVLGKENVTVTVRSSLWITCNKTNLPDSALECSRIKKFDFEEAIKTEETGELYGTIAALVLGGFFILVSFPCMCARNRCGTAVPLSLTLIFSVASIALYLRYKLHYIDHDYIGRSWRLDVGFYIACLATFLSLVAVFASCSISKARSGYYEV